MPEGVGSRALLSSSDSSSSSSSILVLQQWGGFDFADRPQEGILSRRDQVMVARAWFRDFLQKKKTDLSKTALLVRRLFESHKKK
jgi:hypothetical protein